jgi:eukaryotic-like serine/threonine-protein kinase
MSAQDSGPGPGDRMRRQVERLLDEAEEAIRQRDWSRVRECAHDVLALDPANADAVGFLAAADRALASSGRPDQSPGNSGIATSSPVTMDGGGGAAPTPSAEPASFCDGRYEVQRFLGEGGKKLVYLAHDTLLDRDVAFALIKTEGLDEVGRERIRREAQAMGRLGAHPHVVSVFDLGETDGQPFIVTELMGGGDVEGLIEKAPEHRMPLADALRIADEVCRGLEFAHSKQIVHRDLKPGNVWLTADGTAKIGDFGLAVATDKARLTQAGLMVGTVSYMPPEQAMGGEVTPRSDLYSLGAMLYELVTGRPPFVGDESVAIITQHLNTPPVAPSWHAPDLPPGFEALVLRLLEKDPTRRPESASDVRRVLDGISRSLGGSGRIAEAPTANPQPLGDNPVYRRTFVGREVELRQLQSTFDAALSGQGALVMVVGEPGIGKTALCEQLATHVALRGGKTLVGHCYEEGSLSLPYLAFVEALRSYVLAREPDDLRRELGSGAAEVARIISEVRDRVSVELRPAGDPEDDRWRLFQAVTAFLRSAAAIQPIVLVLEDLHWADRGTLDYLVHLSRNLAGSRLVIVGTYRDVEVDRSHPLSATLAELRRSANFQRVPLRGLTVDEVHRMMNVIRGQDVPWSRAEAIHRQTEGNPLFVQEVLRYLVEEGLVVRDGGRYVRTDGSEPDSGIPEGLRDVIGKRLSRLSPECNRLLAVAAVIGREFGLEVLGRVARIGEDEVVGSLEEGLKVGVLEEQARVGGVRYRFAHAMFRQTLYEELSAARRIRLHQEVGRAIEDVHARRLDDHTAELAEHFSHSSDAADLAKAVQYGERGAQRAIGAHAYGEAIRMLDRAIEVQEVLDPDDKRRRCDLTLSLGQAMLPAGEPERAVDHVAPQAFDLAEELGDRKRAAQAALLALSGMSRAGSVQTLDPREFGKWVERADRAAEPGTLDRVYADLALARFAAASVEPVRRRELIRGALALAQQLRDAEATVDATYELLFSLNSPEEGAERLAAARAFVAMDRAGASVRTQVRSLWRAGYTLLGHGDRDGFDAVFREIDMLITRTPDAGVQVYPLFAVATRAIYDGDLEGALDAAALIAVRGEEVGSAKLGQLNTEWMQFRPRLLLGRGERVLEEQAVPGKWRDLHATLALAHLGRDVEARTHFARLYPQTIKDELSAANELDWLLEAAVLLKDRECAAVLATRMIPAASLVAYESVDATCVARHLGSAAHLAGDRAAARAWYEQAFDLCERVRLRPDIALTHLQLAELLMDDALATDVPPEQREQEHVEALEHLDFAIEELGAMKMQPALERALRHKGLLHA